MRGRCAVPPSSRTASGRPCEKMSASCPRQERRLLSTWTAAWVRTTMFHGCSVSHVPYSPGAGTVRAELALCADCRSFSDHGRVSQARPRAVSAPGHVRQATPPRRRREGCDAHCGRG
ncbi:unnamed protein product [Leptidea sinapis]|uniref:Uncharacterized protein n=1 Tax=Leptidea sinapis TaxID=189913 RepID=A0A5E4Q980_9NEOP|nr:unnamed protein product [Leptidea sinapis]